MPEIRRTVDEIRFYLDSNEAEMTDAVRQAGEDYAEACHEANRRLRRCGEFLNRNLRSEAIQLAEADPDLLEVVSTLDFAGRENWDHIVSMYSLPLVEPLLMDVAEALNEAYALQEPVKKLLDKHRFLALSRAPVKQRLTVLWKLVEQDPTLGTWETDACEMERARLREIEGEARDAVKRTDAQGLQAIVAELSEGRWIEKIPQHLKSAIQGSSREITRVCARAQIEELAARMETALADGNLVEARKLKAEWNELEGAAGLDGFDPISMQASPALRWIAEEDAKDEARAEWEQAAAHFRSVLHDEEASRAQLERSRTSLARVAPGIPEPLEQRFQGRISQIDRREKRRKLTVIGGFAAAVIVVASLAGLLVRQSLRNAETNRLAESLSLLVANGKLTEARQFADEHSDRGVDAHWLAATQALTDAEQTEALRAVEYAALITKISSAKSYDDTRAELDRARKVAKTAADNSQLERLNSQWEDRHNRELLAKTTAIQQRIDAVESDLGRAQAMRKVAAPTGDLSTLLSEISGRLTALHESIQGSEGEFGARVNVLQNELKGLQAFVVTENQKADAIEAIRKGSQIRPSDAGAAKQVEDYVAALAAFTKAFPDDPRTPDFQEVRKEAAVYNAICAWQNLIGQWKTLMPADVDDLRKRVAQCSEFLKQHAKSPVSAIAQQYAAFVQAMLRREEGEGGNKADGLVSKLHELFGGPLMQDVHLIWDNDGNAYYLKGAADFSGKEAANLHFLNGFGGETKVKTIPTRDLKSAISVPASHSGLSVKALDELAKLSLTNWEASIGRLSQLIVDTQNLDPFLKYALLRYTLEYGASGSELLRADLQKPQDLLHDGPDLSTRWMVPKDAAAKNARLTAGQLVARIIELDKAFSSAEEKRQQLSNAVFWRCQLIGRLAQSPDGKWMCATQWTPEGNYELLVPVPGPNNEPYQLESIGRVKDGHMQIVQQERTTVLREGRLVIARSPVTATVAASGSLGSSETSK